MHQKLVPDPFLILVNNPKKEDFGRRLSKNLKKVYFFFRTQSFLMDRVIRNKKGLELVTSHSLGYKISSEKFLC